MEEIIAAIVFISMVMGLVFTMKSCSFEERKDKLDRAKICYELTKKEDCFPEIEKRRE